MFSLKKNRLRGKLIECFEIFKDFTNVDASKLFSVDDTSRTRNNGVKLRCKKIQLDSTKFFFTNDLVREFKLPPSGVQSDTINLATTSSAKVSGKSKLSDVLPVV